MERITKHTGLASARPDARQGCQSLSLMKLCTAYGVADWMTGYAAIPSSAAAVADNCKRQQILRAIGLNLAAMLLYYTMFVQWVVL